VVVVVVLALSTPAQGQQVGHHTFLLLVGVVVAVFLLQT
jgi:hypothetical protein